MSAFDLQDVYVIGVDQKPQLTAIVLHHPVNGIKDKYKYRHTFCPLNITIVICETLYIYVCICVFEVAHVRQTRCRK